MLYNCGVVGKVWRRWYSNEQIVLKMYQWIDNHGTKTCVKYGGEVV